jgi:O-antigen ligase
LSVSPQVPSRPVRPSVPKSGRAKKVREPLPLGTKFVYFMWIVILFDPQWWLAAHGPHAITRVPTVLFAVMLLLTFFKPPKFWFPPLLAFMLYTMLIVPFAFVRGQTWITMKTLIVFYVIAIGTMAFVRNVRQAVPIVTGVMLYQFIWWIAWGAKTGTVRWHPALANYDSFGPLMCIGIGTTYFYAWATTNKKERILSFLACIGCIVGLVSSFARGATLGGGVVLFWIWLRSTRKVVTALAVVLGLGVVGIAGSMINGATGKRSETGNDFFTEMSTMFSGGGTETDREVLWALARRVWKENPVFGVGANNFGAYAATHFAIGDVGGGYNENPERLWGRQLHSTYFQILCEYGTVGSIIFLWILADFFKRNKQMRSKPYGDRWSSVSGGRLELGQLARGLETGMVGFLATAFFYNQIFDVHWLYTLVVANSVLHFISKPPPLRRRVLQPQPLPQGLPPVLAPSPSPA